MYIYIIPHQGLGDILCTNGLIRYLIEMNPDAKKYYLFCIDMHIKTVRFQFRDLKNLKLFVFQIMKKAKRNRKSY